jgi:hypothetical protein
VALDVRITSVPARRCGARDADAGVTLAGRTRARRFAPVPMRLHGPGDVIGIDQRLVVRTDPKPNARNFEPNTSPIVDFDPPDFPWMLTPAKAAGRSTPASRACARSFVELAKTGAAHVDRSRAAIDPRSRRGCASELPDLQSRGRGRTRSS